MYSITWPTNSADVQSTSVCMFYLGTLNHCTGSQVPTWEVNRLATWPDCQVVWWSDMTWGSSQGVKQVQPSCDLTWGPNRLVTWPEGPVVLWPNLRTQPSCDLTWGPSRPVTWPESPAVMWPDLRVQLRHRDLMRLASIQSWLATRPAAKRLPVNTELGVCLRWHGLRLWSPPLWWGPLHQWTAPRSATVVHRHRYRWPPPR